MKIYNISCLIVTLITTSTVFAKSENLDGTYTFIPGDYKPRMVKVTKNKEILSKKKNHQKMAFESCNSSVNDLLIRNNQPNVINISGNNLTFKYPNTKLIVSYKTGEGISVEPSDGGMAEYYYPKKTSEGNLVLEWWSSFGLDYFAICTFYLKREV